MLSMLETVEDGPAALHDVLRERGLFSALWGLLEGTDAGNEIALLSKAL